MESEFVEADVAAVSAQGMRVGAEGEDAGLVVEFDDADFEVFGEGGGFAVANDGDGLVLDAVGEDGFGEVVEFAETVAGLDVFEGGGLVFGGEEVVAA